MMQERTLHHLRCMTYMYIAQTRLMNSNWRQKFGHV